MADTHICGAGANFRNNLEPTMSSEGPRVVVIGAGEFFSTYYSYNGPISHHI